MTSQSWQTLHPKTEKERRQAIDEWLNNQRPKQVATYHDNGYQVRVFETRAAEGVGE